MIFVEYPVQYLNPQKAMQCFMVLMPMNNFSARYMPDVLLRELYV